LTCVGAPYRTFSLGLRVRAAIGPFELRLDSIRAPFPAEHLVPRHSSRQPAREQLRVVTGRIPRFGWLVPCGCGSS
jgi:hypothetical protein